MYPSVHITTIHLKLHLFFGKYDVHQEKKQGGRKEV